MKTFITGNTYESKEGMAIVILKRTKTRLHYEYKGYNHNSKIYTDSNNNEYTNPGNDKNNELFQA